MNRFHVPVPHRPRQAVLLVCLAILSAASCVGQPISPDGPPPVDYTIAAAEYVGVVTSDAVVSFTASYDIRIYKTGWMNIPLPLVGVAITDSRIEGPNAEHATIISAGSAFTADGAVKPAPPKSGYTFVAPGAGNYRVEIRFVAPVASSPGRRHFSFQCPRSPVSKLELTIPHEGAKVKVRPTLAVTTRHDGGKTKVVAFVGTTNSIEVNWEPKPVEALARETLYFADHFDAFQIEEGFLRVASSFRFNTAQGKLEVIYVRLPEALRVLLVSGQHINNWERADVRIGEVDYPNVLKVTLVEPLAGVYSLHLRAEMPLTEEAAGLEVPEISVLGAQREKGFITVSAYPGLRIKVKTRSGLVQINPQETRMPPFERARTGRRPRPAPAPALAFKYFKHPYSLLLALDRIEPKITAINAYLVSLARDKITVIQNLSYTVEKAGTFKFKVRIPAGMVLREIVKNYDKIDDYTIEKTAQGAVVTFVTKHKIYGNFSISVRYEAPPPPGDAPGFLLPVLRTLETARERGAIGIAGDAILKLQADEDTVQGFRAIAVPALLRRGVPPNDGAGNAVRFGYSYDILKAAPEGSRVTIQVSKKSPRTIAVVRTAVVVEQTVIRLASAITYTTRFAPVSEFFLAVPADMDDRSLKIIAAGAIVRPVPSPASGAETAYRLYKITRQTPLSDGSYTISVNYTESVKAGDLAKGVEIGVHDLKAHRVAHQERFVAVHRGKYVELRLPDPLPEGLEQIDPSELESMPSPSNTKPNLAFRYIVQDRPVRLALGIWSHEYEKPLDLFVRSVNATTLVSDAQVVQTTVTYLLTNKGRQYLKIALPKGSTLLTLRVDGEEEQAREGPDVDGRPTRLIRLPQRSAESTENAGKPIKIEISYRYKLAGGAKMPAGGTTELDLPRLFDVPAELGVWHLYLPEDREYYTVSGDFLPRSSTDDLRTPAAVLTRLLNGMRLRFHDLSSGRYEATKALTTGTAAEEGRKYKLITLHRILAGDGEARVAFTTGGRLTLLFVFSLVVTAAAGLAITRLGKSGWILYSLGAFTICLVLAAFAPLPVVAGAGGAAVAAVIVALVGLVRWLGTGIRAEVILFIRQIRTEPESPLEWTPVPPETGDAFSAEGGQSNE